MEFGKVDQLQSISFDLPSEPYQNAEILATSQTRNTRWSVGLTGWREPGWKGDLYPPGLPANAFLSYYARSFNCIELNSSFYHPLALETIRKWIDQVPAEFRFCPKLWQGISHSNRSDLHAIIRNIQLTHEAFGDHLGPAFLQLPPRIGTADIDKVVHILDNWSPEQLLFLEVRDKELIHEERLHKYLINRRIGLLITDVAGFREGAHMHLTIPRLFLRFVATGQEEIDRGRIRNWVDRLRSWHDAGLEEATLSLHHHLNREAPKLARLWLNVINEAGASFFSMKTPVHYRQNNQRGLFD